MNLGLGLGYINNRTYRGPTFPSWSLGGGGGRVDGWP